jgi:hypothetical protein
MYQSIYKKNFYYICPRNSNLLNFRNVFFEDKKILKYSTYDTCFDAPYNDKQNLFYKENIDSLKIDKIDEKVVYVTYWPECYGHVLESLFHLHLFLSVACDSDSKILLNVPLKFSNLLELIDFLFGDRFINAATLNQESLIKFTELTLIQNYNNTPNFFKFSDLVLLEKIRKFYTTGTIDFSSTENYKNIFLTRSINSPHDEWSVLKNFSEINYFFESKGFTIIDPQNFSDKKLFQILSEAEVIVTTNGSALCPLIALENYQAKIYCLNSQRYLPEWRRNVSSHEELEDLLSKNPSLIEDNFEKNLWKSVTSKFNFSYVDSFDNRIDIKRLEPLFLGFDRRKL